MFFYTLMSALVVAVFCAGAAHAFSVGAGFLGLGLYVVTGGIKLWSNIYEACRESALDGSDVWKKRNCVAHIIFYLVGAATSFGAGSTGSEYIDNGGVTKFRRAVDDAVTLNLPHWNWSHVEANTAGVLGLLGGVLPGDHHSVHYNISGIGIDNSVTIVKSHGSDFFIHSSNITHGVVSHVPNATETHADIFSRDNRWEFGGMKGVKFSYSNPGCEREDVSDTHFDDYLGEVCWNAASWMENNWADKYSLELSNSDRYGSPYVGGYLIAETNGFGHNYEGSPVLHDCFEG